MSVKISELPILDSLADNDVIAGVDTSANVTSKIEMATLKSYIDTNTQYTAGTNINITNNVISAPFVYDKTQTNALLDDFKDETNASIEDLKDEKDEQIEELQSEVDSLSTIFNAFPTESGEGESLTLDDTAEVKFKKFDLKGNASQNTTTGKNLFGVPDDSNTNAGVTVTTQNNKITFVGTPTRNYVNSNVRILPTPIPAGTYTVSGTNTSYNFFLWFKDDNNTTLASANLYKSTKTITLSENCTRIQYGVENLTTETAYNIETYFQIESGSTATDWEKYTGGNQAPNPDFPEDVHVVSGDNKIKICGKNMFDDSVVTNLWSNYSTQQIISSNGSNLHRYECKQGDTFALSATFATATSNEVILIQFFDKYGNSLGRNAISQNTNLTLTRTAPANTSYAYIGRYLTAPTTIQLEKNTQATTYELYQGKTYNIDLPVENLFNIDGRYETGTGISYTKNDDGSYTLNGTANGNNFLRGVCYLNEQHTISYTSSEANTNVLIRTRTGTPSAQTGIQDQIAVSSTSGSLVSNKQFDFVEISIVSGTTLNNFKIYIQLEKGSKANTYTPYGTTPIELCKIGNYQDYFYKDSGKWYLHKEIGKVVLDGSERGWVRSGASSSDVFVGALNLNHYGISIYSKQGIASSWPVNRFNYGTLGALNKFDVYNPDTTYGYNNIGFGISTDIVNDIDAFKTWVSNNNIVFYYPLATSTAEEITYQPLIDQLNLLEKAMSKDSQTNISQVNNDLGFIICAEAIKSLENVLDRLALVEE